jgi:hypothetical protein
MKSAIRFNFESNSNQVALKSDSNFIDAAMDAHAHPTQIESNFRDRLQRACDGAARKGGLSIGAKRRAFAQHWPLSIC